MDVPFNDLRRGVAGVLPALEDAALRVLRSGWYVQGEALAQFESAFAAYCGAGHCVGVANGTDALELALRALGVVPGDRVACVANAGFYAATAVLAIGAEPQFVDIDEATLLLDAARAHEALATRPKALVVTHLFGRLAPIEALLPKARELGIPVVEDCAQAHGAQRGGVRAGAFGAIGCFSFYPTKNLGALGDGGACVTSDAQLATRLRALRQYGWAAKYRIETTGGRNSRLDELQAALLGVRLGELDRANRRRREIAARYAQRIRHPAVALPGPSGDDDVVHLYVVRSAHRDRLAASLRACGIGCDVHYPIPDHWQPAYRARFAAAGLPRTESACAQVLSLPCFPELADEEVDTVAAAVNAFDPADGGGPRP
jgi:dTDP-4-amino-4,6-dideoxygalactose transaminase